MKKVQFLLASLALATLAHGQGNIIQAVVDGDSIRITAVDNPANVLDFQIIIQNANDLGNQVWWWSGTGEGVFPLPYCNAHVHRVAFDSSLVAVESNTVHVHRVNVEVQVQPMSGRRARVQVSGVDSYLLSFSGFANIKPLTYYTGWQQHWPQGQHQEGSITAFVPYPIPGPQIAIVRVEEGGCSQTIGYVFYW